MRIGIITGVEAEAVAFLPDAPAQIETVGSFAIRTVEHGGHTIAVLWSGIGKVNAGVAAALLAQRGAHLLMVIGTAGKLSDIAGDCFVIASAVQGDYGAARGDGFVVYDAGSVPIGVATVTPLVAHSIPDVGLPRARIVSGDCFVECGVHGARLRDELGGDLVDMETAAVAQAALRLGLPWAAIKATTDDANGASAADFQANLAHAAAKAADGAARAIAMMG